MGAGSRVHGMWHGSGISVTVLIRAKKSRKSIRSAFQSPTGLEVEIEILGEKREAEVLTAALYDVDMVLLRGDLNAYSLAPEPLRGARG